MSLQILPPEQGFASSLGAGLGSGLSEQIPKEIQRYRMKSGLENLGKQKFESPLEQVTALASIPGIDPGMIGILAPLIQQQQMREQALALAQGPGQAQAPPAGGAPTAERGEETFQSPVRASPEEIDREASVRFSQYPAAFGFDFEKAKADVRERKATDFQRQVDINERGDKAVKAFDDKMERILGRDVTLQADSMGYKFREKMRQEARQMGAVEGSSPTKEGEKFAAEADKVVKAEQNIRDASLLGNLSFTRARSETVVDDIRHNFETLKKAGVPLDDAVNNLASNLGTDRAFASFVADDLSETKAGRAMRKIPFKSQKMTEADLADKMAPLITSNDLMGSMVYLARQKGFNAQVYQNELRKRVDPNTLTKVQENQLNSTLSPPGKIPIKQWYLQGLIGKAEGKRNGKKSR